MSSIRSAIERVNGSGVAEAEQKDAIRALEELGNAKAEIFIKDIQASLPGAGGERNNRTIPINFMVGSHREVRAFYESELYNIGDAVTRALNSFLSDDKKIIINGLSSCITSALQIFLGSDKASSDTIEMYFIATDGSSPVRIDIKAWYYLATAESIRTSIERVITVVATKSVIDVNRIDLGTFRYLFERQFDSYAVSPNELEGAVRYAADVYNTYVDREFRRGFGYRQHVATPGNIQQEYLETVGKVRHI